MFRTLILTAAAASLISISARAADPSPAIAGIKLGMTQEEVTSVLKELKGAGEKEAGKPKLSTYSAATSDGTGRFTIAQTLVIEYPNRPKDAVRRTDKDRIVVVFSEFNDGRVVSVMRGQFFAKQKPAIEPVEAAIKDTYGIALDQKPPFKNDVRFGLLLHDKGGKVTDDKKCAQTTAGWEPQFGPALNIEGFSVWNVLHAHCGVLLKVTLQRADNPSLVHDLEQEMIDTQAMIADGERSREVRRIAEEAKKRKTLDDAKKVIPKL